MKNTSSSCPDFSQLPHLVHKSPLLFTMWSTRISHPFWHLLWTLWGVTWVYLSSITCTRAYHKLKWYNMSIWSTNHHFVIQDIKALNKLLQAIDHDGRTILNYNQASKPFKTITSSFKRQLNHHTSYISHKTTYMNIIA